MGVRTPAASKAAARKAAAKARRAVKPRAKAAESSLWHDLAAFAAKLRRDGGVDDVLTADKDFQQEGFTILL